MIKIKRRIVMAFKVLFEDIDVVIYKKGVLKNGIPSVIKESDIILRERNY